MYKYFISFNVLQDSGQRNLGFGNCDITREQKIEGIEQVTEIAEQIARENNLEPGSVTILYFNLFD
ncbi:hypothetical protein [Planococcus alpniumensis]|uniref:hypothetical protein n=1 Tax=Planococcus alpniumensis TaxID=2708345 RepID=UPI001B8B0F35|nr:hypothetical protein [Planococcus sp. MSAK28401]